MDAEALRKPLRYRWLIFWILAVGYALVYFHRLCPAVVAVDMMKDLGAGGTLLGVLGAAYFYPYAVMQLPAGLLSDSWGPRRTITLFFVVAFAGSLLLGLSSSLSLAIAGRILVGLGVSMLFVPTMKILAEWFRVQEFATMTGILMAMGGLGSLTAATPLALLSARLGWRACFVLVGGATFVLAVLVWVFVRDRPSELGWSSPAQTGGGRPAAIGLGEGIRRVLSLPAFWPLAVWFFFDCAIFFSFGGLWGGPYLMHVYKLTKAQAGQVLSMFAVGMIVGSPLLGHLSNRVFRGRKPVLILVSVVSVALTAALAFATDTLSLPALYAVCFGLGVFTSSGVVIGFTGAKELFPVQMAGTSTGLANLFPFAGGAVFQPVLGRILETHGRVGGAFTVEGYRHAFFVLFVCGLVCVASSLFVRETLGR